MLPRGVILHRDRTCAACPTPCVLHTAHAGACDACPLPSKPWGQWDCDPSATAPTKAGDRLAAAIEQHVLTPAERYAPGLVATVRKCGGCAESQRALNGGGLLPGEKSGPPIV